ncbi:MAG: N-acetyl-gamma-glutamyl-phosphate reductase, partial [Raoultibacter sp.]
DAVFLAVPHTAAMAQVPALLKAGISVFDLSADYRLKDADVYEKWYATKHTSPELLEQAAFGLPELFRAELARVAADHAAGTATLVACAGCYPTATSLAAYPAVNAGFVDGTVIVDAISGVTGAGKKATERTHFCFANESVEAYGVGKHRHTPEIEQILGIPGKLVFTPHLAPLNRGLLSTVYLPLVSTVTLEDLHARYTAFYADDPFVNVLPLGTMPKTSSVAGSNYCHIGLALSQAGDMLIAVGAIDNLCKGAAGQAVQCANIVFGLDETTGLSASALPV